MSPPTLDGSGFQMMSFVIRPCPLDTLLGRKGMYKTVFLFVLIFHLWFRLSTLLGRKGVFCVFVPLCFCVSKCSAYEHPVRGGDLSE
jgi:hypothetical protein